MTKMQKAECDLKAAMHRVDDIEKRLNSLLLTMENRERFEAELESVKEVIKTNEEKLQGLRKENTKSFMVAASMVFACFLFYGLYLMIF